MQTRANAVISSLVRELCRIGNKYLLSVNVNYYDGWTKSQANEAPVCDCSGGKGCKASECFGQCSQPSSRPIYELGQSRATNWP